MGTGRFQGPKEKVDGELGSTGPHWGKVNGEMGGVTVTYSTGSDQEGEFFSQFNGSL